MQSLWADQAGCRACSLQVWLDLPPAKGAATPEPELQCSRAKQNGRAAASGLHHPMIKSSRDHVTL